MDDDNTFTLRDGELPPSARCRTPIFIPPVPPEARSDSGRPVAVDVEYVGRTPGPAHEVHHPEREHGGCEGTCANFERLLDDIRHLRSTKAPAAWSEADHRLFRWLPEVPW